MWVMDLFHFASIDCFERCYCHPGLWFPFGQGTNSKWWPLPYVKVFLDLLGGRFEKTFSLFLLQAFSPLREGLPKTKGKT